MKRKYTLRFDESKVSWVLKHDGTEKVVQIFKTKKEAIRAGVLRKILGRMGGNVILRTKSGSFEEERMFRELKD